MSYARLFVTVVAAALLVAACQDMGPAGGAPSRGEAPSGALPVIGTRVPQYSDPLAGLYRSPASAVPEDVPVSYYASSTRSGAPRNVLTMALVPGANYGRLRSYHAQVVQDAAAAAPGNAAIASDLQIQPVLLRAVDILKQRYAWLELTDDIATAERKNASLTIVLDMRSVLGNQSGDPTSLTIEALVFDEHRRPISRIEATGSAAAGTGNVYGFQDAAKHALDAFAAKSNALLN